MVILINFIFFIWCLVNIVSLIEGLFEKRKIKSRYWNLNDNFENELIRQQDEAMRQHEYMSIGIEFGGGNPDINLNPATHHMMDHMFSNFNNFHNGMF